MVRCKMTVNEITESMGGSKCDGSGTWVSCIVKTVKMSPVTGGSDENKRFWEATPSGQLVFTCVNPEAVQGLKTGKDFYVDISPA